MPTRQVIFLLLSTAIAVAAESPTVVTTVPADGDLSVDPATSELIVTFDQDMKPDGYSFVGGGPSFPETRGAASWVTARECRLPIKLLPGHSYRVGINGGRHQSFCGVTGGPAVATTIEFTTSGGLEIAPAAAAGALAELRELVRTRYSHADRLGLDWDVVFASHRERVQVARTPRQLAGALAEMMAAAEDRHIWFEVGSEVVPAVTTPLQDPSLDFEWLRAHVPHFEMRNRVVYTGRFDDDIAYLLIASWQREHAADLEAIYPFLGALGDAPGLVIDMRGNTGGDETLAQRFAGCFVEAPAVYAKHQTRDPDAKGGWSASKERRVEPTATPQYRGKIVVLMGGFNLSSAEASLLMLRQVKGCQLIGARSAGSSGNPQPYALGSTGVTARLPSWRATLVDGSPLEGVGIAPDVEVLPDSEKPGDEVLERALEILRK